MALARQRPTVMVKLGLMEEARTMSLLSPVARMERPSRVPRNHTRAAHMASTTTAQTTSLVALPRPRPSASEKMVSLRKMERLLEPITIRLTV